MGEKCVEFKVEVPGRCHMVTRETELCEKAEVKTYTVCMPEELANLYLKWLSLLRGASSAQTAKPAEPKYSPSPATTSSSKKESTWCDVILSGIRCY